MDERESKRRIPGPWIIGIAAIVLSISPAAIFAATGTDETELWVEVLDEKGRLPADLGADDFEIVEGELSLPVAEIRTGSPDGARVVLYFDQALAGNRTIKRASESLSGLARQLTGLGEVEIVMADEAPEVVLRGRDEIILAQRLTRGALVDTGSLRLLEIRRRTLRELRPPSAASPTLTPDEVSEVVTAGILEEIELVRERLQHLVAWAFDERGEDPAATGGGPRVLVLMLDGFDLDPVGFYTHHLDAGALPGVVRSTARLPTLDREIRDLSRTLAAAGWTVFPVTFPDASEGTKGLEYTSIESTSDTSSGPSAIDDGTTSAPGFKLRPGSLFGRRKEAEAQPDVPEVAFIEPLEPLRRLADESGGDVVISDQGLRDAVERLGRRVRLSYRSQLTAMDGSRRLEVRAKRPGWTVRARRWQVRGTPEAVAGVRLRRLLEGFESDGGFDVAAVLRLDQRDAGAASGRLEARLNLRDLEAATPEDEWASTTAATFRVSVAVAAEGGESRLRSEIFEDQDLGVGAEWSYGTDLELPEGATEVAVLIEDLERGTWGGRRATVVQGDWADSGDLLEDLLPPAAVVEIQRPDREVLRGRIRFEADVYLDEVAAVEFLLDDRRVARLTGPPYAARIDLGRTPRRRDLSVIAYDGDGDELGRDTVVLNGGSAGLTIDIVRPEVLRATGAVDVEAEIAVPVERRLDRVLFFWNNEPVATVYGPPFRQRVNIPSDKPTGYVRVVAMLDDGTTAEDVIFMNGPAASDRLDVHLVELYVVVTDRDGRPVRGLTETDFRIREQGREQQIATFSDASDLPLTLGMAIDSSASMFVKLPRIQRAAIDFLHSTFSDQDRAFVVDFDTEPRLVRGTTHSLDRLVQSIYSLEANGRTALWESIVFSLVQLQEVRGRKALIVFSDGADEDDHFPFRSAADVAKRMGVPIYIILMKKEPKESIGLSLFSRSFTSRINRLVEATGGRVFYAKEYSHLGEVYEEIDRELRSQYLLAYYPGDPGSSRAWRKVDVEVAKRGLVPRTLSGYWQ
ncbi:MAG: VWA domain-containing protein [Thermoanaerobaculia bacterium]